MQVFNVRNCVRICGVLQKPNLKGFEPFGVPCTLLKTSSQPKFGEKAIEGYFLGYMPNSPNKRAFNKETGMLEIVYNIEVTSYKPDVHKGLDWQFDYSDLFASFKVPISDFVSNSEIPDNFLVWR